MPEKNPDWEYFQSLQEVESHDFAYHDLQERIRDRADDTKSYYEWLHEHARSNFGDFWKMKNTRIVKEGIDFKTNSPKYHIYM